MDEIKRIPNLEFEQVLALHRFDQFKLAKDYFLTALFYLIKDVDGIYFKGGTAINKILLNHARLSEDIDFTVTREISEVKKEIVYLVNKSGLFREITQDKDVEGFLRIVVHYKGFANEKDAVLIDLNKRGDLILPSEVHELKHFYSPFIPEFSIKTLAIEELVAEKVAASIGRNKPRDHFDVYKIIHAGLPINLDIVKKKCLSSGHEFSIIKMFNQSKKLKNRWDKDMASLISESISFQEIIKFLSKHFKFKEEKENVKKSKV
jgi:predicted nucleotidyltransferase component of viral defense system